MTISWELLKKKLEVPKDEQSFYDNDKLTNRDLIPIPPERRTWTPLGYFSYWIVEGVSISGWTTGSTIVAYGLSVRQALGCTVAAGIIYGFMAVIMGWIGSHHHIGFTVISRFCWGVGGFKGKFPAFYFPVIIRLCTGIVWVGVQAYYGGQAVRVVIAAMNPSYATWDTFDDKNGITSADFVGLMIYMILFIPCIMIPPEKIQTFFRITFVLVFGAMFGILGWAIKTAGGAGAMLTEHSSTLTTKAEVAWAVVMSIFSVVGTAGTGILGQSDWARYSTTKRGPAPAQFIGAPIAVVYSSLIGCLVTSAVNDIVGETVWNPLNVLSAIQSYENNSKAARAGVFFGGLAFVGQQLAINLLLNSVSTGMDLAGLCPKYLNMRRASLIVAVVGLLCWPWKLQANATAVIILGNGWGCFCSGLTGIIIAKYFFIYKRKILLQDLYVGNSSSIYWFWHGFDWRAAVAWIMGTAFTLPGLVAEADGKDWGAWNKIFKMSYPWGIIVSATTLIVLELIFPGFTIQPDTKVDEVYTEDGVAISKLDSDTGLSDDIEGSGSVEKISITIDSKK
ncbi:hypothetical protein PACTADRAFT_49185 [Pachysolen tannophilus NRRL Y-2460]|uniref:Uracil permease n=1 Tax=Pachysolen tannophilus NRRL Y-2460 TaxID=669874 RepID=A0A1E4U0F4_PACTA|nr:hypothetical protein PACTADRAFT_49185 [Pachysolen tannophilus NRRL Y-2460]